MERTFVTELKRSREELAVARQLAEFGYTRQAVSRAYYAAREALEAIGESPKSHPGLRTRFAKLAQSSPALGPEVATALSRLDTRRGRADYGDDVPVTKEEGGRRSGPGPGPWLMRSNVTSRPVRKVTTDIGFYGSFMEAPAADAPPLDAGIVDRTPGEYMGIGHLTRIRREFGAPFTQEIAGSNPAEGTSGRPAPRRTRSRAIRSSLAHRADPAQAPSDEGVRDWRDF